MRDHLTNTLRSAAARPDALRKDAFLRAHRDRRRMGGLRMLLVQAGYAGRAGWGGAALLLLLTLLISRRPDALRPLAALMPFASASAVAAAFRSRAHGMAELEGATRFSLRGVLLARRLAIGLAHAVLLGILTLCMPGGHRLLRGLQLLAPYLLCAALCLEIERRAAGRRGAYGCAGVSAALSVGVAALYERPGLLAIHARPAWALCCGALAVWTSVAWKRALDSELEETVNRT